MGGGTNVPTPARARAVAERESRARRVSTVLYQQLGGGTQRVNIRRNRTADETEAQYLRLAQQLTPNEGESFSDFLDRPDVQRLNRVYNATRRGLEVTGRLSGDVMNGNIRRVRNRR